MILDNLYASEIRFSIVTEWDAGYRVDWAANTADSRRQRVNTFERHTGA